MTQTPEMLAIGDLAIYGTCTVRISSVTGRGIAAPYYRFSCVDYGHEHPKGWGDLTSHRLLAYEKTCSLCNRYLCADPDCETDCCQPSLNNGKCTHEMCCAEADCET